MLSNLVLSLSLSLSLSLIGNHMPDKLKPLLGNSVTQS